MSDTPYPFHENTFLRVWIIATMLGVILGTWMNWYTPRLMLSVAQSLEGLLVLIFPAEGIGQVILTLPTYLVTTTHVGAIIAFCVGFAQWWAIRSQFEYAKEWLIACVIGALLSFLLMAGLNILAILFDPANGLLKGLADSGLWLGTIMGIIQWRMLQKYSRNAIWWLVASVALWGAGATLLHLFGQNFAHMLGSSLMTIVRKGFGIANLGGVRFFTIGQVIVWSIRGIISGWITGKLWWWLVNEPREI